MFNLRELKGGAKHKYLREHRREILGYLSIHGEYKTLQKYGTTIGTLERLIGDNSVTKQERISDVERVKMRVDILQESVKSLNSDMRALENSFSVPVEELADNIRNYVVIPLLKMAQNPNKIEIIKDSSLLEINDNIDNVAGKWDREGQI